ncbi:hypothetical protein [Saccharopolyspora dendranthemae]|uniref:Uncharacterized protein n=1 Tax=Saccharopolyspora dendranthemae TaxID=1181886 RepID=A0A561U0L4_9PSEU|nr:hypothetical protein [Saccharopolyspora dendranthemae]TWF92906.1 hypothetical protein FHU35_16188 [Saccharopolyspora dendranthemae]
MPHNPAENGINAKPHRIVGIVVGGFIMIASLVAWFPYLGASLTGFDSQDSGPGVTNKDLIQAFFGFWIIPWAVGMVIVLASIAGWLRRAKWVLLGLTGIMLAVSLTTYLIGSA